MNVKGPFYRIHIDHAGPFPLTPKRNRYLLVAIDPCTKYVVAKAVTAATAVNAVKFLVENVIFVHGCPVEACSDRGQHFLGQAFLEILNILNVKHFKTTSFHRASDGACERCLKTFKEALSHYLEKGHRNWDEAVPGVTFALNSARSDTTGYPPNELAFGRVPLYPMDAAMGISKVFGKIEPSAYGCSLQEWLDVARETAETKSNSSHDREAPRLNAKRQNVRFFSWRFSFIMETNQ